MAVGRVQMGIDEMLTNRRKKWRTGQEKQSETLCRFPRNYMVVSSLIWSHWRHNKKMHSPWIVCGAPFETAQPASGGHWPCNALGYCMASLRGETHFEKLGNFGPGWAFGECDRGHEYSFADALRAQSKLQDKGRQLSLHKNLEILHTQKNRSTQEPMNIERF